jgi:Aspartyl protease
MLARLAVLVTLSGCATVPPEREERDRAVLAAIDPCKQRHPELFGRLGVSVTQEGIVRYWYKDYLVAESYEFDRCISEMLKGAKVGPFAPGQLAANALPTSLAVGISGAIVIVPVRVNGVEGLMRLGTNSAVTYVKPAYAKRAGLEVAAESPKAHVRFSDQNLVVPFVRAKQVQVGSVSVERLDIVVHDHPGLAAKIEGVLGASFLSRFKVAIDRSANRLTLEPIR